MNTEKVFSITFSIIRILMITFISAVMATDNIDNMRGMLFLSMGYLVAHQVFVIAEALWQE